MALVVSLVWDSVTFILCLVVLVLMYRLYAIFRGGNYAKGVAYYVAAVAVLSLGYGVRVVLDLLAISPESYGYPVRDPLIVVVLVLLLLGTRSSAKVLSGRP